MEPISELKPVTGGLSPSSLSMFLSCQRKYFYKKVIKVSPDDDAILDTKPFMVGKAFHKVLEDFKHELDGVRLKDVAAVAAEFELEEDETIMVAAMLSRYKDVHAAAGLKAVACEVEIITGRFHGFVDVVLQSLDGSWYIADMKTSASWNPSILPTLPGNPQLNLYAAHAAEVAKLAGLDLKGFKGCRYRVTTKSRLIRKATESVASYYERVRAAVASLDIVIPVADLQTEKTLDFHLVAFKHIQKKKTAAAYPKNPGNCMNYNKPCEYWSQCYGFKYTAPPVLQIIGGRG